MTKTETKPGIKDIAEYLDAIGLQYMATIGLDGKPKVRPVQYMVVQDGKLWFCTNSQKSMYTELQQSPYIELCGSKLQRDEIRTAWIRLSAEAVFPDESPEIQSIKSAIMAKSSIVHELYHNNPDHPLFKVFYLKNIRGSFCNLGHVKGLEERQEFSKPIEFAL